MDLDFVSEDEARMRLALESIALLLAQPETDCRVFLDGICDAVIDGLGGIRMVDVTLAAYGVVISE